MSRMYSLAVAVLAISIGAATLPALAGQPAMTRQMPENGMGMSMGRMGHGMMGGSMMGRGMMGGGMMGMMGDMMVSSCDSMMQSMNGGRPNNQWSGPHSRQNGMRD